MNKEKRVREVQIKFRVTEQEHEAIRKKMTLLGTSNMGAYMRKMAIDGYAIKLDLPEIREMISLLRRYGSNLNQLTKRVHETGNLYKHDMEEVRQNQEKLWDAVNSILVVLSHLR